MSEDDWFDESADVPEMPRPERKGKKPAKRHKPEPEDWEEGDDWGDFFDHPD